MGKTRIFLQNLYWNPAQSHWQIPGSDRVLEGIREYFRSNPAGNHSVGGARVGNRQQTTHASPTVAGDTCGGDTARPAPSRAPSGLPRAPQGEVGTFWPTNDILDCTFNYNQFNHRWSSWVPTRQRGGRGKLVSRRRSQGTASPPHGRRVPGQCSFF